MDNDEDDGASEEEEGDLETGIDVSGTRADSVSFNSSTECISSNAGLSEEISEEVVTTEPKVDGTNEEVESVLDTAADDTGICEEEDATFDKVFVELLGHWMDPTTSE